MQEEAIEAEAPTGAGRQLQEDSTVEGGRGGRGRKEGGGVRRRRTGEK